MKKNLLIIGGAILVVGLLIAAWVYVMFFGTPRELPNLGDTFDFGLGGNEEVPLAPETPVVTTSTPTVNVASNPLRQLTTRPVIGYRELTPPDTSSNPVILYAEAGTGHIYSIDLVTGVETRRSGTTIIEAAEAVFSADGRYVVYRSGYNRVARTIIGTLATSSDGISTTAELGELAENVHIEGNETLFYSVRGGAATAKSRNLRTGAIKTLFSVPMSDPVILWGSGEAADHFIYPKPSYLLPGYVYRVRGGSLLRLPVSGFGLSAFRSGSLVGISTIEPSNGTYNTTFVDTTDNTSFGGVGVYIPEKCTNSGSTSRRFWCVEGPLSSVAFGFPDTWHRGEVVNQDTIFAIDISATSTTLTSLSDTFTESGRIIDGIRYSSGTTQKNLYFINRLDNTLWAYALTN